MDIQRPRNLDWKRAAALLYGDWGTSKAYVVGLAFVVAGFSSLPIIIAVCVITAIVGVNYMIVCRCFPDGGGVYSAAARHGRLLAVVGALLLVAGMTVTAALSGWAALSYLGIPPRFILPGTILLIAAVGVMNYYGPKHSGSVAVALALPTLITVVVIVLLSAPHLTIANLEPPVKSFVTNWVQFCGVILALSGVEAIASLTGVMKPDRNSTPGHVTVEKTARKSILPVAIETSIGTALLAWGMLSLPKSLTGEMMLHQEDMLRFMAEHYAKVSFGPGVGIAVGIAVGIVFALLLVSAVNTAIAALIGLLYMTATKGDMPSGFTHLNRHGVPFYPLLISVALPIVVLIFTHDFESLAGLYAIGVVGAIAVNIGSCTFDGKLPIHWYERILMGGTFVLLLGVELTIAKTKPDALFFIMCILIVGLALRAWVHKHTGIETLTVSREVARIVKPDMVAALRNPMQDVQKILVCVRGITPVLRYAFDEAKLRNACLYVLYVREVAVLLQGSAGAAGGLGKSSWKDEPVASAILSTALQIGEEHGVSVIPLFASSNNAASIIVDSAATIGADFLMLGASHRDSMSKLLRGNVVTEVASSLPESIQLVIYG